MKAKIIVTLIVLFFYGTILTSAQSVKVKSMKLQPNDKTAVTNPQKDLNGTNCALIKMTYTDEIDRIEGNVIGDILDKGEEKWIYLSTGSKEVKIIPVNQQPFTVTFSKYGIRSVLSNKTYKLVVEVPQNEIETEDTGYPSKAVESFTVDGVTFKMVRVKGGEFTMGATPEQAKYALKTESPAHPVVLSDFYIATTEVTQALWDKIMDYNPSPIKGANLPVEGVSIEMCETFFEILSSKLNLPFRPLSEAEWEFAARGGLKSKKTVYSGSNKLEEVGWYKENSGMKSHPVATKKPNELGIYDMSGNVFELTRDMTDFYKAVKQYDPVCKRFSLERVIRGGSWMMEGKLARNSSRAFAGIDDRASIGLRIALDGVDKEEALEKLLTRPAKCTETKTDNGIQFTIDGVKFNMIKVDGGTFKMGATKEQRDAHKSEKPVHPVTVSDYYIAETEVTQELWRTIVHESPFEFYGDKLPAEHLKRDRILKFLQRLTNITGWQFRLPTEAEWEFAARGGNKSKGYMYSGSNNPDEVMWYFGNAESENQEVAKKKPNELGLYDMSGNVQEWCSDYYGPYQKSKEPVVDPKGPESGEKYVLRGGSCDTKPWYSRVSMRNDGKMAGGNSICGVRMVMVPKK